MFLLVGSSDDLLVREVQRQCRESRTPGMEAVLCGETDLFGSGLFSLEKRGRTGTGFLRIEGREFDLAGITGVLLRPPRLWWPGPEFDLSDQVFVYHETVASWFALFASLECPVFNRFGLGWWLQDLSYPLDLRSGLAWMLGTPVTGLGADEPPSDGRLPATERNGADGSVSMYLAGRSVIPAPGCSRELEAHLAKRGDAIAFWQAETGVSLCRVDFEVREAPRLKRVEGFPLFGGEEAEVLGRVAAAALAEPADTRGVLA